MSTVIAILIKPLFVLVLFGLILLPIRLGLQRFMRDGKMKRFLLRELWPDNSRRDSW